MAHETEKGVLNELNELLHEVSTRIQFLNRKNVKVRLRVQHNDVELEKVFTHSKDATVKIYVTEALKHMDLQSPTFLLAKKTEV